MKYAEIVLNVPVPGTFTYISDDDGISAGIRASVMFGRRKMTGFIVAVSDTVPKNCSVEPDKLKKIDRIIDKEPVFTEEQIHLAEWISHYYLCTFGEALSIMIPSGRRESEPLLTGFDEEAASYTAKELSDEQIKAIDGIFSGYRSASGDLAVASSGKTSDNSTTCGNGGTTNVTASHKTHLFHYLYGKTGSGKTEVFLGAAEKILSQGRGVIYLVPEIALTSQVVETVAARFGKTAAVIHSGLTGSQKLAEWKRILKKEARVIVGARSAIFAPVPDLGLIIIDEEHDNSYKSDNTPRYHARQVAMYRAMQGKFPVIMGSATPSSEAWKLMEDGTIVKHVLTKRLAGGKEPDIEIIDLNNPSSFNSKNPNTTSIASMAGCISPRLADEIRETHSKKRQTILFLNRRGFTHFFRCNTCGFELKCKNCSVSLTYHKNIGRLICHYCGWSVPTPAACPECNSLDIGYNGFGTEFIEAEVRSKFPECTIDRIDTDTVSKKGVLQEKLEAFRTGKTDILLGTQMVAKGLNFTGLKLVGVILADSGLHMPDFRAAERTFSLIVQVAGRAGRFFPDGKVLVQTYSPGTPAVSYACNNDIEGFYRQELEIRQMTGFPPYSRLLRLVFRSADNECAINSSESAAKILYQIYENHKNSLPPVEILGPAECPLGMISANYRRQLLLRSESMQPLQKIVHEFISNYKNPSGVYTEIDVDPVSLL
ncbi:MAG: primosomal protein N' [Treponemataceae bacterium]|nr:primosomal protein N' [Treponemataceae bacterium]